MTLSDFESHLGYSFQNKKYLGQALSHKSFLYSLRERLIDSNERLEFLGDAVLDLAVSDLLMSTFPEDTEGNLTKKRAALVNETTLSEIAQELCIDKVLLLGPAEIDAGLRKNPRLLASCFEALIGGLYQDGGYVVCYTVLNSVLKDRINSITEGRPFYDDYKTKLQEIIQKKFHVTPDYELVSTFGPEHQKIFEVEVRFQGKSLSRAQGKSKKIAEQLAAQRALEVSSEL